MLDRVQRIVATAQLRATLGLDGLIGACRNGSRTGTVVTTKVNTTAVGSTTKGQCAGRAQMQANSLDTLLSGDGRPLPGRRANQSSIIGGTNDHSFSPRPDNSCSSGRTSLTRR